MSGLAGERLPNATLTQIENHVLVPGNIVPIDITRRFCGDGRQIDVIRSQIGAIFTFGADAGIIQARLALLHRANQKVTAPMIRHTVDGVVRAYSDHGLMVDLHTDQDTEDPLALKDGIYRFMTATKQGANWTGCGHNKNAGSPEQASAYGLDDPMTMRIALEHLGSEHTAQLRVKVLGGEHQESAIFVSHGLNRVPVPYNPETLQAFVVTPEAISAFVEQLSIPGVNHRDLLDYMGKQQGVTAGILASGRQQFHIQPDYNYPISIPGEFVR